MNCLICEQQTCDFENNTSVCFNCLNLGYNIHYDLHRNGNLNQIRIVKSSTDRLQFLISAIGYYSWEHEPCKNFILYSMGGVISRNDGISNTIKILKKRMKFECFV